MEKADAFVAINDAKSKIASKFNNPTIKYI